MTGLADDTLAISRLRSFVAGPEGDLAETADALAVTGVDEMLASGRVGDPLHDVVLGRYRAEAVIGRGAMGVVVRAHDPELDRAIAIKLVDPGPLAEGTDDESRGWRARLRGEARAMAQLRHPNVVAVHDAGAAGDQLFVAMELVDGENLSRWIAAGPDPARVLAVCIGAGRGVCAAHAAGLIHGDIKPDNILVDRDGRALVGDFGLATAIGAPAAESAVGLVGTPAYMAPERLRGGPPDPSSDQFSFAVTVYEAYAGGRPWRADSVDELERAIDRVAPARPPRMPRRVWRVVARGLAIDPAARHPSMAAMVGALERAASRRTAWIAGGAAAIGLTGVAITAAVLGGRAPAACPDPLDRAATMAGSGLCGSSPSAWCAPLADELARRSDSWRTTHVAVCRATRDGAQSPELLDRRMGCLERRRLEHAAVVGQLASPLGKPDALDALGALHRLDAPATCATFDRPGATVRPGQAAAIVDAERWVADARAAVALGHYTAGQAALAPRLETIRALGQPALLALASMVLGQLEIGIGHVDAAEAVFDGGLKAAAEAGDDEMTAMLLLALAHSTGELRQQWDRAAELLRAAETAMVRAGRPPALEATLLLARGTLAEARSDFTAAGRDYTDAVALRRRLGDPTQLAIALQRSCGVIRAQGKLDDARAACGEALVVTRGALGDDHPLVAEAEINLAVVLAVAGDLDAARQTWESALARLERGGGAGAPAIAAVLLDLENVCRATGDDAAADLYLERALALPVGAATDATSVHVQIRLARQLEARGKPDEGIAMLEDVARRAEATLGDRQPVVAYAFEDLGILYYDAERYADARTAWGRAVDIATALYGERNPSVLALVGKLGQAMLEMGDPTAARPVFERARLGLEATSPADSSLLAQAYTNEADCTIALGDPAGAIDAATRGLAIREQRGDDPLQTSEARFVLARALWGARRDPRAVALARTARDEMIAIGPDATTLPQVKRWLAGKR